MRKEHETQIENAIQALKARGEVNEVYFVACGGSQAVLMAGQYLFDRESNVPSHVYTANEFVYDTPKNLCERSLVISCSHSGNTPETIAATKLAREKGAMTIALSNLEGSELWKAAEFPVHYDWGKDVSDSDKNKGILYGLLFNLLNVLAPNAKWDICLKELEKLTELSEEAKAQYATQAKEWAKAQKRDPIIIQLVVVSTMVRFIQQLCVGSWKCSGSIQDASILVNISMAHLKLLITMFHLCLLRALEIHAI